MEPFCENTGTFITNLLPAQIALLGKVCPNAIKRGGKQVLGHHFTCVATFKKHKNLQYVKELYPIKIT